MPSPTTSLATLRPDLMGSLQEYDLVNSRNGFIGLNILPVFEVAKPSGVFGKIPIEQLLQNRQTLRAPHSGYSRGTWKFETDTFQTQEHGAEEPVDDKEAAIYAEYFDAELISADRARDVLLRNMELRIADAVFNATTFTSQKTTVVNEWDDAGNATPIDDIETAVRAVWARTGLWPNTLILNRKVFRNLRNAEQVVDRINSQGAGAQTRPGDVTIQQLAAVFDLERILVGDGVRNTAGEGVAATLSSIWSDEYAMVARTAIGNDIREPSLGRTFHWGGDGSQVGGLFETYRDEMDRSDIIRVRHEIQSKLIFPEGAQLLDNITT